LERVSGHWSGNDPPANWLRLTYPRRAQPRQAQLSATARPLPVVTALAVYQDADEQQIIDKTNPSALTRSSLQGIQLGRLQLDYFIDNINATDETVTRLDMAVVGNASKPQFTVVVPGQPDRSVVRVSDRGQREGHLWRQSRRGRTIPFSGTLISSPRCATAARPVMICSSRISALTGCARTSPKIRRVYSA